MLEHHVVKIRMSGCTTEGVGLNYRVITLTGFSSLFDCTQQNLIIQCCYTLKQSNFSGVPKSLAGQVTYLKVQFGKPSAAFNIFKYAYATVIISICGVCVCVCVCVNAWLRL